MNARTRRTVVFALAALLLAACGGFSNEPLRFGTVRGRVLEADPATGFVAVAGQDGLRAALSADGAFELRGVAVGRRELFVVASAQQARRVPVEVRAGRVTDLSEVAPEAAAWLRVLVTVAGRPPREGEVSLPETPYESQELDAAGTAQFGPLPPGCWLAKIDVDGFEERTASVCLEAGDRNDLKVPLDGEPPGCANAGCPDGQFCSAEERCVECLPSGGGCAAGERCVNGQCVEEQESCRPCQGDGECGEGGRCEPSSDGQRFCMEPCPLGTECEQGGFVCMAGLCMPDPYLVESCDAFGQIGSPCEADETCLQQGLLRGLCSDRSCTYACTESRQCPEGFECAEDAAGHRVCRASL